MASKQEKELSDALKRVLTPSLLLLGVTGNLMSIRIFTRSSLHRQTTFRYLTYLSLFDLLALVCGYGQTMIQVYTSVDIRLLSDVMCKAHSFLVYVFSQSSSLVLVSMSVDRTLLIIAQGQSQNQRQRQRGRPRRRVSRSPPPTSSHIKMMTTSERIKLSKKVLAAIVVFATLMNAHFILFAQIINFDYYETSVNSTFNFAPNSSINSTTTTTTTTTIASPKQVYKICYAPVDSLYFVYLVQVFPWYHLILILNMHHLKSFKYYILICTY